jgi:uncharacterized membrane protein
MPETFAPDSPAAPHLPVHAPVRSGARIVWPHVILGAAGIAISLWSVKLHNIVKAGGSACDISTTISCDKVLGSPWAAPFGIPVGLPGAFFFALIILTAISTAPNAKPRAESLTRLLLASAGICGSVALLYISKVLIGAWCPICIATHSIVLLNFLAALWNLRQTRREAASST